MCGSDVIRTAAVRNEEALTTPPMSLSYVRVNGFKRGGDKHSMPYTTGLAYAHPSVDSVPSALEVDVPKELGDAELALKTIEEAIELYLDAHRRKFSGKHGVPRKAQRLGRFLRYLNARGHSTKLSDLAFEDGQGFMASLANMRDGRTLGPHIRKRYRGTLRSFGRFLASAGLIDEDVFFRLHVE
jgi:hypothetical protein